ncbi:MAG: hypothetical protein ACRCTI_08340, partial [Beijerinckiaceae bacterium]
MDIAGAIRAQMIGQLIDALSTGAGKTPVPLPAAGLTPGQSITAAVLGEVADGKLAVRIGGQAIVADIGQNRLPAEARQPGAQLQLTVATGGATPRL